MAGPPVRPSAPGPRFVRSVNGVGPDQTGNVDTEAPAWIDTVEAGWTAYTPTLSGVTLGNGTISGAYKKIGRIVHVRIELVLGSTSTVTAAMKVGLPFAAVAATRQALAGYAEDVGTNIYMLSARISRSGTTADLIGTGGAAAAASPFTWSGVNGDNATVAGTYEAAS